MPRRPIVGGNWKCNPAEIAKLDELVKNINDCDTSGCDVYVCPSPLHVGLVYDKFTNGVKCAGAACRWRVETMARWLVWASQLSASGRQRRRPLSEMT